MSDAAQAPASSPHARHMPAATWWALGGFASLTLAPYVLPMLGIGQPDSAEGIMHIVGAPLDGNSYGAGLAGYLQQGIASLPGIGTALTSNTQVAVPLLGTMAAGAITSIAATAAIGIGGVLLANWMEHRETGNTIRWSRVVRMAALATSALIALPGMLGAISVGVTFLASLLGPVGSASHTALAMQGLTGGTVMHATASALNGIAAILPHLFTCGIAALPVVGALFIDHHTRAATPGETPDVKVRSAQLLDKVIDDQRPLALYS